MGDGVVSAAARPPGPAGGTGEPLEWPGPHAR